MKDDYGNTWTFTCSFLTKYTDSNNNVINFNYDFTNWRLTSITQVTNGCSAVTLASFGYSGNNLITSTDTAGNTVFQNCEEDPEKVQTDRFLSYLPGY